MDGCCDYKTNMEKVDAKIPGLCSQIDEDKLVSGAGSVVFPLSTPFYCIGTVTSLINPIVLLLDWNQFSLLANLSFLQIFLYLHIFLWRAESTF